MKSTESKWICAPEQMSRREIRTAGRTRAYPKLLEHSQGLLRRVVDLRATSRSGLI